MTAGVKKWPEDRDTDTRHSLRREPKRAGDLDVNKEGTRCPTSAVVVGAIQHEAAASRPELVTRA